MDRRFIGGELSRELFFDQVFDERMEAALSALGRRAPGQPRRKPSSHVLADPDPEYPAISTPTTVAKTPAQQWDYYSLTEDVGERLEGIEKNTDASRSDHEFIHSLKKRIEGTNFIQIIDTEEALLRNRCSDQATAVLGFFNAASDNLEFYFESGESMAKLVGVGLQHAKVIVKRGITCEVQEIERNEWEKIWLEAKEPSTCTAFKIMKVRLPQTRNCIGSGQLEGGSHVATTSTSTNQMFQDQAFIASSNTFKVPFLWELSKFFIMARVIDAFQTACNDGLWNSRWNESLATSSTQESPKDGNETDITWFQTLKALFSKGVHDANDNSSDSSRQEEKQGGGGGGNGSGNGEGNDDCPGGNSTVDLLKDKEHFSQVNVVLLSGGDFFERSMEPLSNRHPLSIERLDNVKITPELTFGFCKSRNTKKIEVTPSVIFALDRDCDSIDSCGHFGWFHDEIHASFGPLDRNIQRTVYLKHDFKEGESVSGKTTNTVSVSKDTTKGKGKSYQVGLAVGSSQVARLGFGANMNQQVSCTDHQSDELSLESQCNQTCGGFRIQASPVMHEALLEYKYRAPYFEIVADQIQDRKYRHDLTNHPMCNFQKVGFSGTWVPIGNDELVEYIFKADRRLHEIRMILETSSSSSGYKALFGKRNREHQEVHFRAFLEHPITQAYDKQLYVNHAMTHLVDGQTYTLIESSDPQNPYQELDAPLVTPLVTFPILVDYP